MLVGDVVEYFVHPPQGFPVERRRCHDSIQCRVPIGRFLIGVGVDWALRYQFRRRNDVMKWRRVELEDVL